jgi:hypothetical protein
MTTYHVRAGDTVIVDPEPVTPPPPTPTPTTQPTGTLIALPPSIDATGGSDVSAALAAFLGSVGNGTATTPKVVAYRPDGIYRLDNADALRLSGRSYLTLWGGGDGTAGKGAQVKAGAAFGKANPRGVIATVWSPCTGLRFEGFRIYGNVPAGQYTHGVEGQHALMVFAGSDISYVRNYSTGLTGDCVSVGGASDHSWPTRITVTDNFSDGNGRMAFSIVQGRDVVIARNKIDRCGLFVFDIEPDDTQQGAINCQFVDNEAFAYGLSSYYTDYFFAADGAAAVVDGITVSRNKVHGGYGLRSTSEAPRDATGGRRGGTSRSRTTSRTRVSPSGGPTSPTSTGWSSGATRNPAAPASRRRTVRARCSPDGRALGGSLDRPRHRPLDRLHLPRRLVRVDGQGRLLARRGRRLGPVVGGGQLASPKPQRDAPRPPDPQGSDVPGGRVPRPTRRRRAGRMDRSARQPHDPGDDDQPLPRRAGHPLPSDSIRRHRNRLCLCQTS